MVNTLPRGARERIPADLVGLTVERTVRETQVHFLAGYLPNGRLVWIRIRVGLDMNVQQIWDALCEAITIGLEGGIAWADYVKNYTIRKPRPGQILEDMGLSAEILDVMGQEVPAVYSGPI